MMNIDPTDDYDYIIRLSAEILILNKDAKEASQSIYFAYQSR